MLKNCSPLRILAACGLLLLARQVAWANTIDSDVNLTVFTGPTLQGLAAEGRLTLSSNSVTPAKYAGTFVDN
jgi:hypothetical protein